MIITITLGEGPVSQCDRPFTADSFRSVNTRLHRWSTSAPEHGGYDKCDFTIVDEVASIHYAGRFDLKHWRRGAPDLRQHVLDHLSFIAGTVAPSHMTPEEHASVLSDVCRIAPAAQAEALRLYAVLEPAA